MKDYSVLGVALQQGAPESVEAVANFLWELGALGVVEEPAQDMTRLQAFFPPGAEPHALAARLTVYLDELRALAVPVGEGRVESAPLPDGAWADAWRAHFRPLVVGRRLVVCPPWETPPADAGARLVVWIEPGRAFGTGGHATTRGCLELLERVLDRAPVARALDVGAGSGVLAIAAARLGVGSVDAIDVDPDAVHAVEENTARNGVADRVRSTLAAVETWDGPPAALVLANLLASAHVALAPTLARLTVPGGSLVAGGLLVHEVPPVTGAFAAEGFRLVELTEHEGWASLTLGRDA